MGFDDLADGLKEEYRKLDREDYNELHDRVITQGEATVALDKRVEQLEDKVSLLETRLKLMEMMLEGEENDDGSFLGDIDTDNSDNQSEEDDKGESLFGN